MRAPLVEAARGSYNIFICMPGSERNYNIIPPDLKLMPAIAVLSILHAVLPFLHFKKLVYFLHYTINTPIVDYTLEWFINPWRMYMQVLPRVD